MQFKADCAHQKSFSHERGFQWVGKWENCSENFLDMEIILVVTFQLFWKSQSAKFSVILVLKSFSLKSFPWKLKSYAIRNYELDVREQ